MTERLDEDSDEISLLDLLVTVAENWLLLIAVPLFAGIVAYGFVVLQPQSWRASAVVGLPQSEVSRHLQGAFAEPPEYLAAIGTPIADIERGLGLSQGDDAMHTRIGITLGEPDAARAVLAVLLNSLVHAVETEEIVPRRAEILDEMEVLATDIALRERIIGNLMQVLDEMEVAEPFGEQAYATTASALNELLIARDGQRVRQNELAATLATLPVLVLNEEPSPPERVNRSPFLIVSLAVLGTGFVLLVFIFARQGMRNAAADPEARGKIDRIRRAFRFGPSHPRR